jgi:hypothetical protein
LSNGRLGLHLAPLGRLAELLLGGGPAADEPADAGQRVLGGVEFGVADRHLPVELLQVRGQGQPVVGAFTVVGGRAALVRRTVMAIPS